MTAMLVFLLAASLYAADPLKTQINGKELDSINDIIAEVNGGKIGIPKYSVLALPADNKNGNLSWHIRTVSQNGKEFMTYSNFNKPFGDDGSVPEGNGGIFPVTSKYLTGNGKGRYVFIHSGTQRDSAKISSFKAQMYLFEKKNPNDTKDPIVTKIGSTITKTLGSSPNGPTDIMDVKSGLRVEASRPNDEYFVVASVRNYRLNIDNGWCSPLLSFFKLTEDEDGNATFSEEPRSRLHC